MKARHLLGCIAKQFQVCRGRRLGNHFFSNVATTEYNVRMKTISQSAWTTRCNITLTMQSGLHAALLSPPAMHCPRRCCNITSDCSCNIRLQLHCPASVAIQASREKAYNSLDCRSSSCAPKMRGTQDPRQCMAIPTHRYKLLPTDLQLQLL